MASVLLYYEEPGMGEPEMAVFSILMSEQAQIILATTQSALVPSQLSLIIICNEHLVPKWNRRTLTDFFLFFFF